MLDTGPVHWFQTRLEAGLTDQIEFGPCVEYSHLTRHASAFQTDIGVYILVATS